MMSSDGGDFHSARPASFAVITGRKGGGESIVIRLSQQERRCNL